MDPSGDLVAFKDWALVCAAIAQGRQSIILRKGGIAEGRDGFRFKHGEFYLFPTQYHQQAEKVRPEELGALQPVPVAGGQVRIDCVFTVERAEWIDDWETVRRLEPFHVWREEVAQERFHYDQPAGLQCAFGRARRLEPAWELPDRASYGGCRSWINLVGRPPESRLVPTLSDDVHSRVAQEVFAILDAQPLPA